MEPVRALYTLLGLALLPLLPLRLWWRGRREPGYRLRVGERFGSYRGAVTGLTFWIHAVSVGETGAAAPLLQRLKTAYPQATVVLTHMTAAGRDTGHALFGDGVVQAWLPYDTPFAVRSFYAHYHPAAGFLLETELWPNLIARAHAAGIPLYLINARLSERSSRGYRLLLHALTRPMLQRLAGVAAQSAADAVRLAALGAPDPIVTGNLKFDVSIPSTALELAAGLRLRFGATRPVWLAASTRDGEEALLFDALTRRSLPGDPLLVLVPRHPQRFALVAEMLRARGIPFVRRSDAAPVPADIGVMLGDSMGEMSAYCAASDVAFIGGSLLPLGGQNLIEALAVGTPVLVGPHTFNFAEATAGAIAAGAALRVANADALIAALAMLLEDPARRHQMGQAARAFHAMHRGAADRLWEWLAPKLRAAAAPSRREPG